MSAHRNDWDEETRWTITVGLAIVALLIAMGWTDSFGLSAPIAAFAGFIVSGLAGLWDPDRNKS